MSNTTLIGLGYYFFSCRFEVYIEKWTVIFDPPGIEVARDFRRFVDTTVFIMKQFCEGCVRALSFTTLSEIIKCNRGV